MQQTENTSKDHFRETHEKILPLFRVSHLKHSYQGQPVLQIHELDIRPQTIIGLMGPNGSGKSTLLKLLSFTLKPASGEIRFLGKPVVPFSPEIRFKVTLLPQEPYLMKRSVYENINYGLRIRGQHSQNREKIQEALSWVGLSPDMMLKRKWHELSGGEIQRVALAARLVLKPTALLLDEPTTNVDADSAALIRQAALRARARWGTTLIIASHDWPWLYEVCDEVLHLHRGLLYGAQMENIISGPWQDQGKGLWGKELGEGQTVLVQPPPSMASMALIRLKPVQEASINPDSKSDTHYLSGTITRLIQDQNTGDIIVTLRIGNLSVFIRCSREKIIHWKRIPGDSLLLGYNIDDVRWL